jgi:hypothetical protein
MGWRSKFVFLLMVYCAGFATAIYCLAPTPDVKPQSSLQLAQVTSALKSQELIQSFNSGMHKAIGLGKEAAAEAAKLLQAKIEEAAKVQAKE